MPKLKTGLPISSRVDLIFPPASCVTMGKFLDLSSPHVPHLLDLQINSKDTAISKTLVRTPFALPSPLFCSHTRELLSAHGCLNLPAAHCPPPRPCPLWLGQTLSPRASFPTLQASEVWTRAPVPLCSTQDAFFPVRSLTHPGWPPSSGTPALNGQSWCLKDVIAGLDT